MKISCLELSTVIWLQDMRRSHADPQSSSKQQEQQHQQQRTQQEQHVQQQVPATIAVHQEWDLGVAVVGSASFTAAATSLVGALHVFGRLVVVGVVVVVTLFFVLLGGAATGGGGGLVVVSFRFTRRTIYDTPAVV